MRLHKRLDRRECRETGMARPILPACSVYVSRVLWWPANVGGPVQGSPEMTKVREQVK